MPIYEYECKQCGTRFEKVQPVTADPITECVNCGQGPVRRIFHPVGIIFKGSGWYVTEHRKSAPENVTSKGEGGKVSEDGSASSKEDAQATASSD